MDESQLKALMDEYHSLDPMTQNQRRIDILAIRMD